MIRRRAAALLVSTFLTVPAAAADEARVAVLEDLHVDGAASCDIVSVGGDVTLGPDARVDGDVVAVFGTVRRAPSARVTGHAVSVNSLGGLQVFPSEQRGAGPVWGIRALVIGVWLLAVNLALLLVPGIRRGVSAELPLLTVGVLLLGAAMMATVLVALVAALGLGPLAVPAVVSILIVSVLVKIVGVAAVTLRAGRVVVRDRRVPATVAASVALLILLVARLIPVVGSVVWSVVSVLAFGAGVLVLATQRHLVSVGGVEVRPARVRHGDPR